MAAITALMKMEKDLSSTSNLFTEMCCCKKRQKYKNLNSMMKLKKTLQSALCCFTPPRSLNSLFTTWAAFFLPSRVVAKTLCNISMSYPH